MDMMIRGTVPVGLCSTRLHLEPLEGSISELDLTGSLPASLSWPEHGIGGWAVGGAFSSGSPIR